MHRFFLLLIALPILPGCSWNSFVDFVAPSFQGDAYRDRVQRGSGSDDTWREATRGQYDGSLPHHEGHYD